MKRKKIISSIILFICFTLALSGCAQAQALTFENFKAIAEKQSFDVVLYDESDLDYDDVKEYSVATNKENGVSMEYIQFDTTKEASAVFDVVSENIDEAKDYEVVEPKIASVRFGQMSVKNKEQFYSIVQMDDSVLMVYGPNGSEDVVNNMMKLMGF